MFKLAEYLPPFPNATWTLARQSGVTHAVSKIPPDGPDGPGWEYLPLLRMKTRFADAGLTLEVIETGFPWLHAAKLGLPGAEEEIARCRDPPAQSRRGRRPGRLLELDGGVQLDAHLDDDARAAAARWSPSYDHALMQNAPFTAAGEVSDDRLWESLARFMERIVPVAEEAGVKLALHPDDPPISPIRGMARILRTPEAMRRAIDLVPSPHNGITMCQGTFATMGADIPAEIRAFAERGALHFVHFRDVRGTPERFVETFHDDGQTDMFAAMRTYHEIGFDGPLRPDHVPTMEGEENLAPGYDVLGRLFAIGYIKGLAEGAAKGDG